MSTSLPILLLVVLAAIIGGALVWGAPVFALPIVFVVLAVFGALWFVRRGRQQREIREFREQAKTETDFTSRDQLTQS